jgi:mannose-6-phosphate isomerase
MERVEKPWGYEIIWAKTDKYVGKIIRINPGHRLSLQYHENKLETIYVNEGTLELILKNNNDIFSNILTKGESYHIPNKMIHRFSCPAWCSNGVELIEVSTPELNDVIRLEDSYGRS